MSKYLLDANIFIAAYRNTYPMDVIPTFWEKILEKAKDGTFSLIDKIVDEILVNEDPLSDWLKNNSDDIIILDTVDQDVITAYRVIIDDVVHDNHYTSGAKNEYGSSVDSWLIAYAYAYGHTIVTEEVYEENIKKKVKIPNVCRKFGIKCINTIQFLREIKVKI